MRHRLALLPLLLLALLCSCRSDKAPKPPYPGIKIGKPYEIYGRRYEPGYDAAYDEIGMASWYGPGFHGGSTANGERYNQDDLTAAHRTLPMPSLVRVTNLDNGLSAVVRVNDRGPFARNRIIDLSRAAARKLGVIRTGTAKVRVQFLERETREYVQNLRNGGAQYAQRQPAAENFPDNEPVMIEERPAPPQAYSSRAPNAFSIVDEEDIDQPGNAGQPLFAPAAYASSNRTFFVQAGTFSMRANAFSLVNRMSSVGTPQIMEVMMDGKKVYRVMAGPYSSQDDAKNMLSKLASIGISDAKIIRN